MNTIGNRLKKLREEHEFTIESIADFLDMNNTEVVQLENDEKQLTVSKLELLCDLYGVDEDYIIDGKSVNAHRCYFHKRKYDVNTTYHINRTIRNIEFLESILK